MGSRKKGAVQHTPLPMQLNKLHHTTFRRIPVSENQQMQNLLGTKLHNRSQHLLTLKIIPPPNSRGLSTGKLISLSSKVSDSYFNQIHIQ